MNHSKRSIPSTLTNYQLISTLSIDNREGLEVVIIFFSTRSKKREVIAFLDELKSLLEHADFDINSKLVYVKLKIKGDQQRHVLCVSFHYAKEKMTFPYA